MANKKYTDFTPGTPTGARLMLHADPSTGDLESATINDIVQSTAPFNDPVSAYRALGSQILSEPIVGTIMLFTTGFNMVSQRIYMAAVYLRSAQTVNGVAFWMAGQGNYTANNHNGIAVFSYSGGTLTQVGASNNNGNLWKGTANTMIKEPFPSAVPLAAGIYFIQALYCSSAQVVAPALLAMPANFNVNMPKMDFTNSAIINGQKSSQTAFTTPVNINTFATEQQTKYLCLY